MIRLQKYLAMCGVASRRKCEELIAEGKVSVNGRTVKEQGVKVNPSTDHVKVDGKNVTIQNQKVYILLNKPAGIVSTAKDQFSRKTVLDLLEDKVKERVFPVGRLDYDTEGLILLTSDGELANMIIHPKYHMKKRYQVIVRELINQEALDKLKSGVEIDGGFVTMDSVNVVRLKDQKTELEVTIHEGKNRQIRKMFEAVGFEVIYLKRISIGPINDSSLSRGEWRNLTQAELRMLKDATENKSTKEKDKSKDKGFQNSNEKDKVLERFKAKDKIKVLEKAKEKARTKAKAISKEKELEKEKAKNKSQNGPVKKEKFKFKDNNKRR